MLDVKVVEAFKAQGFVAGPHGLRRGHPSLVLGSGERVADFEPPAVMEAADTPSQRDREGKEGIISHLVGIPLLHSSQQMYAVKHGMAQMGFGDGPVTFVCHWNWFVPGLFTVHADGSFVQEEVKGRV